MGATKNPYWYNTVIKTKFTLFPKTTVGRQNAIATKLKFRTKIIKGNGLRI